MRRLEGRGGCLVRGLAHGGCSFYRMELEGYTIDQDRRITMTRSVTALRVACMISLRDH